MQQVPVQPAPEPVLPTDVQQDSGAEQQGEEEVEEGDDEPPEDEERKSRRSRSRSEQAPASPVSDSPWSSPVDADVESTRSGSLRELTRQVKVRVSGDAKDVWLVAGGDRFLLPASVYPGKYVIHAQFKGATEPVSAGEIEISTGGTHRIRCDAFLLRCR